ncbi:ribbon-helix-helix domain-containing protein [Xaviernesmea oryzae]|uniref:ribbon-helix-helix domain-containing protein n=1 Tax=Xaviernesmea oryzae TaxID=464029 RepID=UPI0008D11CA7|nr:type II toxin-antitoxin system ParD family antitoxin [Xaviernesmea oryzae]SEK62638.1 antitoxin ParD1/3/4 [Xaviernesmea oryzae]
MAKTKTLNIAVTVEQASVIKDAIETGAYANSSEIIGEALEDWAEKRRFESLDPQKLRRLWAEGKASGDAYPADFDALLDEARGALSSSGNGR